MHDLSAKSAYELKTPYAFWQETEGIPMYDGYWIEDVRTVELGRLAKNGGQGSLCEPQWRGDELRRAHQRNCRQNNN